VKRFRTVTVLASIALVAAGCGGRDAAKGVTSTTGSGGGTPRRTCRRPRVRLESPPRDPDRGARRRLEVAEKLRHTRVSTTLGVYGHLFEGVDQKLDSLLEARFASSALAGD
jgi:hypothetical protein